ncbi:hypothetical protein [Kitasatospora sp. NPDC085464]|uniref:hypothetical protein n=1 Tax=Kitasatospora sp. NPDC085464 TaxID=3364063 RepID=UPI0037C82B4A
MIGSLATRCLAALAGRGVGVPERRWQGYSLGRRLRASLFNLPLGPLASAPPQARPRKERPQAPTLADLADRWILRTPAQRLAHRGLLCDVLASVRLLLAEATLLIGPAVAGGDERVVDFGLHARAMLRRILDPDLPAGEGAALLERFTLDAQEILRRRRVPWGVVNDLWFEPVADRARATVREFARGAALLASVADEFLGADLRAMGTLDHVRLEGVRWDADTRWPPGWAERMRRVSEEERPGSGVFVVVAERSGEPAMAPGSPD